MGKASAVSDKAKAKAKAKAKIMALLPSSKSQIRATSRKNEGLGISLGG